MEMNAGIVASGSTMMNNELKANIIYSTNWFIPNMAQKWPRSCLERFIYPADKSSRAHPRVERGRSRHRLPQNNTGTVARGLSWALPGCGINHTIAHRPVSGGGIAGERRE